MKAYICFYFNSIEWATSDSSLSAVEVGSCILHYRGVYILSNGFNRAFGTVFVPLIKLSTITIFILCFFGCIRLFSKLSLIALAYIGIIAVTSVILLVPVLLVMSSLYDMSQEFSKNLSLQIRQVEGKKCKKILETHLKSCQAIRCQVGNLYHMEAEAKLTTLHNVINGLVCLLVNV